MIKLATIKQMKRSRRRYNRALSYDGLDNEMFDSKEKK